MPASSVRSQLDAPGPFALGPAGAVVTVEPVRLPLLVQLAAAVLVPIALGAAVALSAKPAWLALVTTVGLGVFVCSLAAPRWASVATLFLLVGYVPDVVGSSAHEIASAALPAMLFFAVVLRHVCRVERVRFPAAVKWYAFFGFALLVTTATGGTHNLSEFVDFVGFALLAVVMLTIVDSEVWLRRAIWAVVAAAALLAAISVYQQLTQTFGHTFGGLAVITVDQSGMRSGGPLSPDYFAQMLVAAGALAAYLAIRAPSRRERLAGIGAVSLCLFAIVYTQSRGAFVAIAVVFAAAALCRGLRLRRVMVVAAAVFVLGFLALPPMVRHRISDLSSLSAGRTTGDSSLRGRVAENLAAVDMIRAHPIVGVGPSNFELHYLAYAQRLGIDARAEVRGAHSLYLQSLAELGIVGSIPFFALLWLGLRRSWSARQGAPPGLRTLAEGCFIAWLGFLVCAAALHLSYPRYLWIYLALALTAAQVREGQRA